MSADTNPVLFNGKLLHIMRNPGIELARELTMRRLAHFDAALAKDQARREALRAEDEPKDRK